MIGGDGVERASDLLAFAARENASGDQGLCVRLAGSRLVGKKPPVEDNRPLPLFKVCVERLAKAARPHLYGLLLVRH